VLLLLFYNFHSAVKVSIVCETDPTLYELVIQWMDEWLCGSWNDCWVYI